MFVDQAKIYIKAGDGGDGAVSFHREKYVAAGGPDGGDGGKGGDIVFVVDDNISNLIDFRYKRKYVAEKGQNGGAKNCSGRNAPDLVVKVPRGTVVREIKSGRILADLSTDEPAVIAHGGKGGRGNAHFATSTRQIPKFAKPGFRGDEYEVCLLYTSDAAEGVGLGHEFLRHVERCRLIVHVIDVSGSEGRDPIEDFKAINHELENFSMELAEAPQIVAANKSDMATPEQIERLRNYVEDQGLLFYEISAATTKGTKELMYGVWERLSVLPPVKQFEAQPLTQEELDDKLISKKDFRVTVEDGVYFVEADWLLDILRTANMDDYSSLQYFQNVLRTSGIIDKLEEMGIEEGDTVSIFDFEFEYLR